MDVLIQKSFTYLLNIPENLLRYVRVSVVGDSIVNTTINNFTVYGETYLNNELDLATFSYSFKLYATDKYQIVINVGMYIQTDGSITQNTPINLTYFISYINRQGHYELRKYKA